MKMDAANDPVLQRKKRGDYKPIEFAQLLGAKPQVIKSLEDEQTEIFQSILTQAEKQEFIDWEKEFEECVVEYASDDERPVKQDPDFISHEKEDDSSEEDIGHDELEPELLADPVEDNGAKRKPDFMRKHRSEVETADLEDDEKAGDTIFIDSLPNSTRDIKEMLKVVKQYIYEFEYKFFVEEDSEEEQQLRAFYELDQTSNSIDKMLSSKEKSHIKNFYCIPISVDVKEFDF